MAQKGVQLDVETFSCSICLNLLNNPVAIPCGHSYCMSCIQSFWGKKGKKKRHCCPQCRQTFAPRPALVKNTMLAALVEQLKQTGLQADPADPAGPEDVACDMCPGRKLKAIKSCLNCLASYCEKHLQSHYSAALLQKHKLVEPSKKLLENICSRHDEVMKVFCRTDQQCICILCTMEEHKGHETAPAAAERAERQKELEENRQQIQKKIQDQEKELKRLQQEVRDACVSADEAVKSTEKIFTELINLLQKRRSDAKQRIRSQQEALVLWVKEVQEKLEQEVNDLKRRDAELEQLSHTEDHNQFLQSYASLPAPSDLPDSSGINAGPLRHFEDVKAAASELRDKLQDILRDAGTNTLQTVSSSQPEPKSRAEFLKYTCEITLDPNTAFRTLELSKNNKAAIVWYEDESYTPNPERFSSCRQVLSRQSLTGRCYFEFKWAGIGIFVAVAYKSIQRGGRANESLFGFNDQSWALRCDIERLSLKGAGYTFCHNKAETPVSGPQSCKLGVYLDHSAGVLAFYDVSETMTLLHRVQTTFTQPLYAGLGFFFCDGGNAEFCNLKKQNKSDCTL
ncbi:tripartite motif-containing protein 16-like [Xiphophorus hellerii]|uniref:tripartite motif-containing protein 16-like n=1 Tax=Xiphophorus hellerii TaxID=8084 RepID=UPI0013B42523|nr:tripartite motif-containing protein 16-like [Xiphophorus hellerii]